MHVYRMLAAQTFVVHRTDSQLDLWLRWVTVCTLLLIDYYMANFLHRPLLINRQKVHLEEPE